MEAGLTMWEFTELDKLLQNQNNYVGSTLSDRASPSSGPPNKVRRPDLVEDSHPEHGRSLPQLLDDLPPRKTCDLLFQNFVGHVHCIIILVHLPSFVEQYERFWRWVEDRDKPTVPTGILAENPSFLPLLFAVLFAGSVTCSSQLILSEFGQQSRETVTANLYNCTVHTLSLVSFPRRPTIYSLMAYLISHNLLLRDEELFGSSSYISVALRVAYGMGLHRDGSHFGIEPCQAEVRRRLWWHIIHTDVMASVSTGLPPLLVTDRNYDTRMISEFKDDYIACSPPDSPSLPDTDNADPSDLDSRHMVTVGRYSVTNVIRHILWRHSDVEPLTTGDFLRLKAMVDQMTVETNQRIRRLSYHHSEISLRRAQAMNLSNDGPRNRQGSIGQWTEAESAAFLAWAQKLLTLMIDKTYGLLYQPYVRNSSSLWPHVRLDAIRHCHGFMRTYIDMCTCTAFQPFHWLYPGLYQPLHATAVLLADLVRNPTSLEAPQSRLLIDEVFSLLRPDEGIVSEENGELMHRQLSEGGKEAWSLLRKLRKNAWEKAGLDSEITWSDRRPGGQGGGGGGKTGPAGVTRSTGQMPFQNQQHTNLHSLAETAALYQGEQLPPTNHTNTNTTVHALPTTTTMTDVVPTEQPMDGLTGIPSDFPGSPNSMRSPNFSWNEWDKMIDDCLDFSFLGGNGGYIL
ncbi:hypothetical protein K490DRAFT_62162 [Saccharata proteae CBS 121410]|uniref:Xylanolytic transcriptional activator regulatory domain-containing protein n=1 Tax=Saccharata proteae CBS 121410 TaxID=1314787 RepID=A0A9P4LZA1_9PEZI|nr:hypothetical protein K490DRAFT_62162 [Saccharata proteae CBS 121410]